MQPLLRQSQTQNVQNGANGTPETLTFASKLKKFEQEIEIKRLDANQISNSSLPPPEKRSLLSEDDIKNLKEAEERRVYRPAMSPEKDEDSFYDHLLDNDPFPRPPSIRTRRRHLCWFTSSKAFGFVIQLMEIWLLVMALKESFRTSAMIRLRLDRL